ncbi:MAG: hypothetical protein IE887_08905, partial [Campylobacterales bacterium]|nr:hypothetical protein [Campylobacterales bacterium]
MTKQDFNEGLLGFLDPSPTPFHATQNMAGMFANAGFVELDEKIHSTNLAERFNKE